VALKRYKHPYKNCTLHLKAPTSKLNPDGTHTRVDGVSVALVDFYFDTSDEEIQKLLKSHPEVKELTEEEAKKHTGKIKKPTKYETGPSKAITARGMK